MSDWTPEAAIARLLDHTNMCEHNQMMHPHNDVEMLAEYLAKTVMMDGPVTRRYDVSEQVTVRVTGGWQLKFVTAVIKRAGTHIEVIHRVPEEASDDPR